MLLEKRIKKLSFTVSCAILLLAITGCGSTSKSTVSNINYVEQSFEDFPESAFIFYDNADYSGAVKKCDDEYLGNYFLDNRVCTVIPAEKKVKWIIEFEIKIPVKRSSTSTLDMADDLEKAMGKNHMSGTATYTIDGGTKTKRTITVAMPALEKGHKYLFSITKDIIFIRDINTSEVVKSIEY